MRLIASVVLIAAVAFDCGLGHSAPGQVDFTGTMTVLNRTIEDVTLASGARTLTVPACGEATATDFPMNWWSITAPGRDMFHSGGGFKAATAFVVVTPAVEQVETRPDPLPPCEGRLQPDS